MSQLRHFAARRLVVPIAGCICLLGLLSAAQMPAPSYAGDEEAQETPAAAPIEHVGPHRVRVAQLIQDRDLFRVYPTAVPTLLNTIAERTSVHIDPEPLIITSFADPIVLDTPLIYVNFGQRSDWQLTPAEIENLKQFLDRGGFLMVDAGITAEFLRQTPYHGQHHSFAEWRARPELVEVMRQVYPGKSFRSLPRSHPVYRMFHEGLPDPEILPNTVREFVVNEKWPEGTYSMVGLHVKGRLAVLATPIIAMGWGKTPLGTWETTIGFRIREGATNLDDILRTAAYGGERFEVQREDGRVDIVYCQQPGTPAWVREPDDTYRVFRYYHSAEISEYAHVFYTQLGVNIVLYALTH